MFFYLNIVVIACLLFCLNGNAQQPNSSSRTDTAVEISSRTKDLAQILAQQNKDSLRRTVLENQFISAQLHDQNEKQLLLNEINILKSRDSLLIAKRRLKIDSLRSLNVGVAVKPFRDSIFTIYNQLGSYTKKERASAIDARVRLLADNFEFAADSLKIDKNENGWIVYWRDQMIVSVNDQDALWADAKIDQLAEQYRSIIAQEIARYRDETSLKKMLTGFAFAVIIILIVILIIVGIGKLISWIKRKIISSKGKILDGIQFKGYELISSAKQVRFLWSILTIVKWLLMLTTIYLALPSLLNIFPSTKGYAPILLGYFLNPIKDIGMAIVDYLPNLITIVVICTIFRYLQKALYFFGQEVHHGRLTIPGFYQEWAIPTYQILRVLLFAFLIIVIFPYFPGSDTPIFKGISVFIGILFTFSSAGALGNIIAGLLLTYMRSFAIGDRIKIGELSGDIIEKTLLVTRIRTIKNEIISIPNSQVMNSHTTNYSVEMGGSGLIIYTNITMSYEIPWQKVHELGILAADRVELLEKAPLPFVLQTSLDDFYVTYQVNGYTKNPHKQALIYSELHKHLLDVFHEAGIEILSPHYRAVRDGSHKDMPQEHRGESEFIRPFQVDIRDKKGG